MPAKAGIFITCHPELVSGSAGKIFNIPMGEHPADSWFEKHPDAETPVSWNFSVGRKDNSSKSNDGYKESKDNGKR